MTTTAPQNVLPTTAETDEVRSVSVIAGPLLVLVSALLYLFTSVSDASALSLLAVGVAFAVSRRNAAAA